MAEKYLEINHIKKAFGDLEVLKDISMSVEAGKVTAIIGPSGSGKSTLLRCATMLETMDDGELIYLGEHAVRSQNGRAVYARQEQLKKIKQYYGLVFQNFNLFPHYSVLKNIMDAPVRVQRRNREEVKKQALELLDGVLEDVDSDSAAKQQAVEEASAIAQNILAESNVESLLEAKGYTDCVAYITAQECSVVLAGAVEEADTLIVQEVVMEQTGLTADKIKIIGTN